MSFDCCLVYSPPGNTSEPRGRMPGPPVRGGRVYLSKTELSLINVFPPDLPSPSHRQSPKSTPLGRTPPMGRPLTVARIVTNLMSFFVFCFLLKQKTSRASSEV